LLQQLEEIRSGKISAIQHVDQCLEAARRHYELNAFLQIWDEQARKKAGDIDRRIRSGEKVGRLAGAVIAIKDNILVAGYPATCSSKILEKFTAPYSATVVQKLEAEDAILIGKTNMDEFAMGSSTENSAFGVTRNPHDPSKVPGGSSGGSAVAVAIGAADAALGSDTGGSIRQPASFCGVTGLKPTYGRVSRYGLVAFASSLDQIGPFARNVDDAFFINQIIAGKDWHDATCSDLPVENILENTPCDVTGLRVGVPMDFFKDGLDVEIRIKIFEYIEKLKSLGAEIHEVRLPLTDFGIAVYYILATAEASSNLARYDGVRYGLRLDNNQGLEEMFRQTRTHGFGAEVRRRIILGTYVLSAGYYDAYYSKAQKVRRLIKDEFTAAFKNVDVLITPTAPTTAFTIGEKTDDPLTMYLSDIYTVGANLSGICAISIPAGKHSNGLPFGLQILADSFREDRLLQVGRIIEKMTPV
jgi:aspartyl-tRNA(Asn)/glutamyl-tRNA(Gln) amidotransferase subunit A